MGNISNTLKDTSGIKSFQVIQNSLEALDIYLVTDATVYNKSVEKVFLKNWEDRVGTQIKVHIHPVENIPVESSGKFRMVKNNIKHLIQ